MNVFGLTCLLMPRIFKADFRGHLILKNVFPVSLKVVQPPKLCSTMINDFDEEKKTITNLWFAQLLFFFLNTTFFVGTVTHLFCFSYDMCGWHSDSFI